MVVVVAASAVVLAIAVIEEVKYLQKVDDHDVVEHE